jgi:hypothetical protein
VKSGRPGELAYGLSCEVDWNWLSARLSPVVWATPWACRRSAAFGDSVLDVVAAGVADVLAGG